MQSQRYIRKMMFDSLIAILLHQHLLSLFASKLSKGLLSNVEWIPTSGRSKCLQISWGEG